MGESGRGGRVDGVRVCGKEAIVMCQAVVGWTDQATPDRCAGNGGSDDGTVQGFLEKPQAKDLFLE